MACRVLEDNTLCVAVGDVDLLHDIAFTVFRCFVEKNVVVIAVEPELNKVVDWTWMKMLDLIDVTRDVAIIRDVETAQDSQEIV